MMKLATFVLFVVLIAVLIEESQAAWGRRRKVAVYKLKIKEKIRRGIRAVNDEAPRASIPCDYVKFDTNYDQAVDREEMLIALQNHQPTSFGEEALPIVFKILDTNGDGYIIAEEFDNDFSVRQACVFDDLVKEIVQVMN